MSNNRKTDNKNRYRMPLCTLLLLFITAAFAPATAQAPKQLTLQDALKYALEANHDARKARLDVENAEYRINEVKARALPQINGSASVTHNALLPLTPLPNIFGSSPNPNETILVAFGQKWNANTGISLSQNLFDKSIFTGLSAAKTSREFYQLNAQLTDEQVIEGVATNYYQLLVQRQQMAVIDSSISNTQRLKNILQGLFDNGLAKKIDVDRTSVAISNLQNQRQQLVNTLALLENQLKFYMGMEIQAPITIPSADITSIVPRPVATAEQIDVTARTEYQLLKKQEDLLKLQKEAYKSEYYPTLSLGGNYSYQGTANKFPVFKGKSDGVNWFDAASFSLNLRIPIFNGFATKNRVKQADVSIRKMNEDLANTNLALNLAFENAKTQINNSIITLNNSKANEQLAEEVFNNTQNNYNNGLATLTDLLDAERSLTEARNNHTAALLNYRVAEIQLIKAQGQLKTLLN
jgi:outer membrane protein TolC